LSPTRIALHPAGEVGRRAGRILAAERDLEALGIYGQHGTGTEDRRSMAISSLSGFSVLATDAADGLALAAIAVEDGLGCVLSGDSMPDPALSAAFITAGRALVVAADLACGIAESLAHHETVRTDAHLAVTIAWTDSGKPLRRGEAIPFPDPVGALWGRKLARRETDRVPTTRLVAHAEGPWAAAMVRVTGRRGDQVVERIVGVADHGDHLRALALAAATVAATEGAFSPGVHRSAEAGEAYLALLLRMGLEVACYDLA
jgi:hypothetical protein